MTRGRFTVAGGGPVGALLAILLGRHGYEVGLYEGRPDSRATSIYEGKSINIALSHRGREALEQIGIGSDAKADAIPMFHRAIHGLHGELSALPYGKEGDAIWSVSRGGINEQLLDIAENARLLSTRTIYLALTEHIQKYDVSRTSCRGSATARSTCRRATSS